MVLTMNKKINLIPCLVLLSLSSSISLVSKDNIFSSAFSLQKAAYKAELARRERVQNGAKANMSYKDALTHGVARLSLSSPNPSTCTETDSSTHTLSPPPNFSPLSTSPAASDRSSKSVSKSDEEFEDTAPAFCPVDFADGLTNNFLYRGPKSWDEYVNLGSSGFGTISELTSKRDPTHLEMVVMGNSHKMRCFRKFSFSVRPGVNASGQNFAEINVVPADDEENIEKVESEMLKQRLSDSDEDSEEKDTLLLSTDIEDGVFYLGMEMEDVRKAVLNDGDLSDSDAEVDFRKAEDEAHFLGAQMAADAERAFLSAGLDAPVPVKPDLSNLIPLGRRNQPKKSRAGDVVIQKRKLTSRLQQTSILRKRAADAKTNVTGSPKRKREETSTIGAMFSDLVLGEPALKTADMLKRMTPISLHHKFDTLLRKSAAAHAENLHRDDGIFDLASTKSIQLQRSHFSMPNPELFEQRGGSSMDSDWEMLEDAEQHTAPRYRDFAIRWDGVRAVSDSSEKPGLKKVSHDYCGTILIDEHYVRDDRSKPGLKSGKARFFDKSKTIRKREGKTWRKLVEIQFKIPETKLSLPAKLFLVDPSNPTKSEKKEFSNLSAAAKEENMKVLMETVFDVLDKHGERVREEDTLKGFEMVEVEEEM